MPFTCWPDFDEYTTKNSWLKNIKEPTVRKSPGGTEVHCSYSYYNNKKSICSSKNQSILHPNPFYDFQSYTNFIPKNQFLPKRDLMRCQNTNRSITTASFLSLEESINHVSSCIKLFNSHYYVRYLVYKHYLSNRIRKFMYVWWGQHWCLWTLNWFLYNYLI